MSVKNYMKMSEKCNEYSKQGEALFAKTLYFLTISQGSR